MTKKVRDEIDFILSLRIDGAVEKPSFGRLGNLDCAMAIVNLFYDWRCEEEWYEFPSDALHVLEECVGVVKEALAGCVVPEEKYEVARLALENGTYLLETSTSLKENSI